MAAKDTGAWTRSNIARERARIARADAAKEATISGVAEDPWPVGWTPERCGKSVAVESDREPTLDGWF